MKAPERIYLQVCGDCQDNECDNCKFEDLEDNVTWCKDKIFDKDVEYIRTDAFIEKACEFLNKYISEIEQYEPAIMDYKVIDVHCKHHDSKKDFIEDFKKYIKGE